MQLTCIVVPLLTCVVYTTAAASEIVCPSDVWRVISYDLLLLPPANVSASSEDAELNPDDHLFGRNNVPFSLWCTEPNKGSEHHINTSFVEPVLLTAIISSGFSNGYVTNFTMEYSLSPYDFNTYPDNSNQQQFIVPEIDSVFILEEPVPLQRLRFSINDGVVAPSGRLCWHLTLIGCLLTEAVMQDPPFAVHTVSPMPTSTSIVQSVQSPTGEPSTDEEQDLQLVMLQITLPVAFLTILIVAVIVAAGVFICLCHRRRSNKELSRRLDLATTEGTLKVLDNSTLYKNSTSSSSLTTSSPHQQHSVVNLQFQNAVYENQESLFPLEDPSPYATVGSGFQESMVDNPNYAIPFQAYPPKHSKIDMVSNECYSVSLSDGGYSYASVDVGVPVETEPQRNEYEEPPQ